MITDNTLNELYQRQAYLQGEADRLNELLRTCEPWMFHIYSRSLSSNTVFLETINSHIDNYEVFNR